jgi:hypothetical protein
VPTPLGDYPLDLWRQVFRGPLLLAVLTAVAAAITARWPGHQPISLIPGDGAAGQLLACSGHRPVSSTAYPVRVNPASADRRLAQARISLPSTGTIRPQARQVR